MKTKILKIRFSSCVLCASVHHLWVSRIFLFGFVCDSHYDHSNVAVKHKRKRTKQKATWIKMKNKAAINQCIQFWKSTQRCSPGALMALVCTNWSLISMEQALLELVIMDCWSWQLANALLTPIFQHFHLWTNWFGYLFFWQVHNWLRLFISWPSYVLYRFVARYFVRFSLNKQKIAK